MPPEVDKNQREMTLFPGEFAFLQDLSNGRVAVFVGPHSFTVGGQERPVIYNEKEKKFLPSNLTECIRKAPVIPEGFYCYLLNPAKDDKQPVDKKNSDLPALDVGRRISMSGPKLFTALWPGQVVEVIRGHRLRSNQYLLIEIYNKEEATKNWQKTIAQGADGKKIETPAPDDLEVGKQYTIKGTEIAFYIPPTGIKVVDFEGNYIREALTLERLEYCVLVDENGNKRVEQGPAVVFPEPTEQFRLNPDAKVDKGEDPRKTRAIEMTNMQSIHIRVIADYNDEVPGEKEGDLPRKGKLHKAGEEFVIKGKDVPIYFPREEHALVRYDGQSRQYAVAIPKGEGRYILERETGNIKMVQGPNMYLANPITEVFVRRALTDLQCDFWYPNNPAVKEYNRQLRELSLKSPTTRAGAVTEGELRRARGGKAAMESITSGMDYLSNAAPIASAMPASTSGRMMDVSDANRMSNKSHVGDASERSSTYSAPRTLTLDTKLEGVPTIIPWTGYAVQVVGSDGSRRVEEGPKRVLLAYDEELELLTLSTGKPKTTDNLLRTPYLQIKSNKVSDVIEAETMDHVTVEVKYSLIVNFEGDSKKWFNVSNYVKLLTDHIRSLLKAQVKKSDVRDFYLDATEIVRSTILGVKPVEKAGEKASRPGMFFEENNMRVTDVDVLAVVIKDRQIADLLALAAVEVVKLDVEVSRAKNTLDAEKEKEIIGRELAREKAESVMEGHSIAIQTTESNLKLEGARATADQTKQTLLQQTNLLKNKVADEDAASALARKEKEKQQELNWSKQAQDQQLAFLEAETTSIVQRFEAAGKGFTEAIVAIQNQDVLVKMAQAVSVQTLIGGKSIVETLNKVIGENPVGALLADAIKKGTMSIEPPNGAGNHGPTKALPRT
jgi:major vault protein